MYKLFCIWTSKKVRYNNDSRRWLFLLFALLSDLGEVGKLDMAECAYSDIAGLTYNFFQFIGVEIVLSCVFTITPTGQIRYTFSQNNQFKKTLSFVIGILIIVIGYYFVTKQTDVPVMNYLCSLDIKVIPLFIMSGSLFVLYAVKVSLRRHWSFPLTYVSLGSVIFFTIFFEYITHTPSPA